MAVAGALRRCQPSSAPAFRASAGLVCSQTIGIGIDIGIAG